MEWYRNLRIVLSTEDKLPFLEQPIPTLPIPPEGQANPPDVLTTHQDWVRAQKEIIELMLITMDPDIQKNLEQLGAYDMLKELKMLYIDNLEHLGHAMTQNLFVSLILVSLRKEYDDFVQNYNMHIMGKTVNELQAMLKLHEQTLPPKEVVPALHAIRAPPFAPKPKNPPTPKKDNPARDAICHQCGEVGCGTHICITTQGHKGSRKLKPGALSLYVGNGHRATIESIGDYHLCLPKNKVYIARKVEFFKNEVIDHEASGSLEDLEIIQEEDTHPSLYTSLDHEEDDQEIDEPQSDINPIRRSTGTRRAPDCMCLYINGEEHELRDLGEPANYKAALLDPKFDKWLNSMNVEMQSMKDNKVWELVKLHLDAKTVGHKWLFKKKTDIDGAVHTYKARLVAKGFTQTLGIDSEETFSPVADIRAIRILIAITAFYDYEIWQMDVKTSFLNGYLNEENPSDAHWTAVKNILKCLRNTKDMFLVYEGDMKRELRISCYINAGYLTDADDMKSQTEYVFVLNRGIIEWKSTKQSIFATSSKDTQYIAAFDASKEAV
ncbi:zinc finger, CCHC-type containing protein [Tanacetum coccineum]